MLNVLYERLKFAAELYTEKELKIFSNVDSNIFGETSFQCLMFENSEVLPLLAEHAKALASVNAVIKKKYSNAYRVSCTYDKDAQKVILQVEISSQFVVSAFDYTGKARVFVPPYDIDKITFEIYSSGKIDIASKKNAVSTLEMFEAIHPCLRYTVFDTVGEIAPIWKELVRYSHYPAMSLSLFNHNSPSLSELLGDVYGVPSLEIKEKYTLSALYIVCCISSYIIDTQISALFEEFDIFLQAEHDFGKEDVYPSRVTISELGLYLSLRTKLNLDLCCEYIELSIAHKEPIDIFISDEKIKKKVSELEATIAVNE